MRPKVCVFMAIAVLSAGFSAAQSYPLNDECSQAYFVAAPTATPLTQDTTYATYNPLLDPSPSCGAAGCGVWYTFTPYIDGTATINTCASTYDTVVEVLTNPLGCASTGTFSAVACSNDDCGTPMGGSWLQIPVVSGTQYFVHVFINGITDWLPVRAGGSLSLNLDGAVSVELTEVKVD